MGAVAAAAVAVLAAAFAVSGGAGERDARVSFVLEPEVRQVSKFDGASVAAKPRPPGSPIPIRADVSPPFAWPVDGPITSYNNSEHPLGIDIGLSTERSREIKAAAAGTVTFSGGSPSESYGLYIVIDHRDGVETLYGHLSQRIAQTGARVEQGQLIGIGGSTGKSDGMHLHFEITHDGRVFDPLDFLPEKGVTNEVLDYDCTDGTLTIDAGSRARLDLAGTLVSGESIVGIAIRDENGASASPRAIDAEAQGVASLEVRTGIAFEGPEQDDAYVLAITTYAAGQRPQTIECAVTVHTPRIPGTYYVRTSPAPAAPPARQSASPTIAPSQSGQSNTVAIVDEPFVLPTNTPYPIFLTPLATGTPSLTTTPTQQLGLTVTPAGLTATATPAPTNTPAP